MIYKIIIIAVVTLIIGLSASYFLTHRSYTTLQLQQPIQTLKTGTPILSSSPKFNTDDNLGQALQDLDQIK